MKTSKIVLPLTPAEYRMALRGLVRWRNKLLAQGRYTDAVDELIVKLEKSRRVWR